jgi:hypothetical protein
MYTVTQKALTDCTLKTMGHTISFWVAFTIFRVPSSGMIYKLHETNNDIFISHCFQCTVPLVCVHICMVIFVNIFSSIIMHSLYEANKMNTYRVGHVCLSVHMIQPENQWTALGEICLGVCVTGVYPKIIIFNFLPLVIIKWWTKNLPHGIKTSNTCNRVI